MSWWPTDADGDVLRRKEKHAGIFILGCCTHEHSDLCCGVPPRFFGIINGIKTYSHRSEFDGQDCGLSRLSQKVRMCHRDHGLGMGGMQFLHTRTNKTLPFLTVALPYARFILPYLGSYPGKNHE